MKTYILKNIYISPKSVLIDKEKAKEIICSKIEQDSYFLSLLNYKTNKKNLDNFFNDFYCSFIPAGKDLINHNKNSVVIQFFHSLLNIIDEKDEYYKEKFFNLCVSSFWENKNYPKEWNILEIKNSNDWINKFLNKNHIMSMIYKELSYNGSFAFNYVTKTIPLEDILKYKYEEHYYEGRKKVLVEVDLKTKLMKDIYYSGHARRRHKVELLDYLSNRLKMPDNLDLLLKFIPEKGLFHYKLAFLNNEKLNNRKIYYSLNNSKGLAVEIETTLMNAAKYNSMKKNLTQVLYQNVGYGLNKKEYFNFEELAYHFMEDSFLKTHMHVFMREKAKNSKKSDIKAKWNYFILKSQEDFNNTKSDSNRRKNKI